MKRKNMAQSSEEENVLKGCENYAAYDDSDITGILGNLNAHENPFRLPAADEIFQSKTLFRKNFCQDLQRDKNAGVTIGSLRQELIGKKDKKLLPKDPSCGLDISKETRSRGIVPQAARDYIWSVEQDAKERYKTKLLYEQSQVSNSELIAEERKVEEQQNQLGLHHGVFQHFLNLHYSEVSATIEESEKANRATRDQNERLDYFSGLLKAAETVQEEEKEKLQELTAFQHFLAAVTPQQSLKDLMKKLEQVEDEDKKVLLTSNTNVSLVDTSSAQPAQAEQEADMSHLRKEVAALRMVSGEAMESTMIAMPAGAKKISVDEKMKSLQIGKDDFNPFLFDPYLNDPAYLQKLSQMYENQCHALLGYLTRLKQKTETVKQVVKEREHRLETRLKDLKKLQEDHEAPSKAGISGDTEKLISEWSNLAGDKDAKIELVALGDQIASIVSDVFGSGDILPPALKSSVKNSPNGEDEGPPEGDSTPSGLGHGALLALLEARVTDLCSQLDLIEPSLRNSIFLKCEKERRGRVKDDQLREEERQRVIRRKRHLERALASPPPRRQ